MITLVLLAAAIPTLVDQAPAGADKLARPGTRRGNITWSSASRGIWVDANGWKIRRNPSATYFYDSVPAQWARLAMAEAYAYGANASIRTDPAGQAAAREMSEFLPKAGRRDLPDVADVFVVDDGSAQMGEVLNLMTRRNLLYDAGKAPQRPYPLVVQLDAPGFPREKAANPADFSYLVRKKLGDEKRSLRVFGSETVVGRLSAAGNSAQLHLLNYSTDAVEGIRVRVAGAWKVRRILSFADGSLAPDEVDVSGGATEFGLPKLTTYAVVDLEK